MSASTRQADEQRPAEQRRKALAVMFNVPNQLTSLRLILAVVLFVMMEFDFYLASTVIFLVAASTDWMDGYWARKYGQVTTLGRIFDPFVDKFIICGTFIMLAATPGSGLVAWMAVVVVGREMLVTALRGYIEQQGGDFSANMAGKLKMVFQCAAAALSLYGLTYASTDGAAPWAEYHFGWSLVDGDGWNRPTWLGISLFASVWLSVVTTVYSGLGYIFIAIGMLRKT